MNLSSYGKYGCGVSPSDYWIFYPHKNSGSEFVFTTVLPILSL